YSYARNNPLMFVDSSGNYVCGSSMTSEQCTRFQTGLDNAQSAANKLKEQYGSGSRQYLDAQRSIDAYGKAGVNNGVTIEVGDAAGYGGGTEVKNTTGKKTEANPSGQSIKVLLTPELVGDLQAEAHEGSHVADGSDWVKSG